MFKNILVPTDGSHYSQETIRKAVAFAREIGASITAFYAKPEHMTPYYLEGVAVRNPSASQVEAADERLAAEILSLVENACAEAGVKCSTRTTTTRDIYVAILAAADEAGCDLIFMASHGRSGLSAVLLGSETIKVLTHSKIPVLVCR
jgi:nucleotide-binding universal stress UspA family protein